MLLRLKTILDRLTLSFVPVSLRQVYWADLPLFLSAVGLVVRFFGASGWPQATISGAAIAGGLLLFLGWAFNSIRATSNGAAIMAAVWGGQLAFLVVTFGDQVLSNIRETANLILGLGFFTLAIGLWWATVKPNQIGE